MQSNTCLFRFRRVNRLLRAHRCMKAHERAVEKKAKEAKEKKATQVHEGA